MQLIVFFNSLCKNQNDSRIDAIFETFMVIQIPLKQFDAC